MPTSSPKALNAASSLTSPASMAATSSRVASGRSCRNCVSCCDDSSPRFTRIAPASISITLQVRKIGRVDEGGWPPLSPLGRLAANANGSAPFAQVARPRTFHLTPSQSKSSSKPHGGSVQHAIGGALRLRRLPPGPPGVAKYRRPPVDGPASAVLLQSLRSGRKVLLYGRLRRSSIRLRSRYRQDAWFDDRFPDVTARELSPPASPPPGRSCSPATSCS